MSRMRFVMPETVRLELSDGDWIEVKRRLSYGDLQSIASLSRMDLTQASQHTVAAYLLDWSLVDESGVTVDISTDAKKLSALRAMIPADFAEIDAVIDAHVQALDSEKKAKAPRGKTRSGRISGSAA